MSKRIDTTNSNNQLDTLETSQSVKWAERECERCGETYKTMGPLADIGRDICAECRDPLGLDLGRYPPPRDRPLMEYGPLSL